MEMQLVKKILDEIADFNKNTRVWMVFYGEPLTIKKLGLYEMIAYAKEKGIKDVVLNSNGVLLDRIATGRLIDAGLDQFYIGIDAYTPETYQKGRNSIELAN